MFLALTSTYRLSHNTNNYTCHDTNTAYIIDKYVILVNYKRREYVTCSLEISAVEMSDVAEQTITLLRYWTETAAHESSPMHFLKHSDIVLQVNIHKSDTTDWLIDSFSKRIQRWIGGSNVPADTAECIGNGIHVIAEKGDVCEFLIVIRECVIGLCSVLCSTVVRYCVVVESDSVVVYCVVVESDSVVAYCVVVESDSVVTYCVVVFNTQ